MIKHQATAEQIRREILRRLQDNADLGETCWGCQIPLPKRTMTAGQACNWVIDAFPGVNAPCLVLVEAVTREVMREYDLE
ncbi:MULTISPECIES: hypothetical protein [unclassified Cupriavidus]|uniref:hypothetical protein n=1 Tax=unclassified Cupriavidus TaxID=2640874 RepID=UPI001C003AF9|nr:MULTISPECIES: hypothetical protein [unclassified Cupriavidus]MCA3186892.1 hypothetical protein [Cupriavidus sp.]MCA3194096.1 hypothetical protein [Cupriavidus sp.]MCA3199263.1 hypothetical protein [Cupriavidus sp.]MCA3209674.1 hypothetical protein [Cupriavidus sp.]MCA3236252.1 hypothetical protein [Cupriavidus sp.]